MQKIRYEIDPHNRLTRLHTFRKTLDGKFSIGKNNTLIYHIKAPVPRGTNIPHQLKLRGKWSLDSGGNLRLTLDKWLRQTFGDRLTLTGEIVGADRNALIFTLSTQAKEGTRSIYCLRLNGSWMADRYNRLTFRVKKERGMHDTLILDGIWEVNKDHQIIYRLEKSRLIRKSKKIRTLIFKGHWNVKDRSRISYILEENTNGSFDFRTGAGLFRQNYIKYEIGIGLSCRARPVKRRIILFGKWKIKKGKSLVFEIKYGNGKIYSVTFGADIKLTSKDTLLFRLRTETGKPIGANLKLSRDILKGRGRIFTRLFKSKKDSAIHTGAAFNW